MDLRLRISGLSKTYPNGVRALDDVALTVPAGLFGLLGPNGAGKSTLMRTIATLQAPDEGSIEFDGIDVLREPGELRRVLGYLPQDFGVYPRVSARGLLEHIAVLKGLTGRGERRDSVEGLLRMTGLWEVRDRRLGTFSGGMKRRFGIAQALLADPRLVIVDEPTAGLDPEERERFHNLLAALGEKTVVLLSTHIVGDVAELCGRMAILSKGVVLRTGRPREVAGELAGRVWGRTVARSEVATVMERHRVLTTRLSGGDTVVHVYAEEAPDGFAPVDADLEHAYFFALRETEWEAAA